MDDPKQIYLSPYCEVSDDRYWCEDDIQGDWCHCEQCDGKDGVRYVRADIHADLERQLSEARELVEAAFREGWSDGHAAAKAAAALWDSWDEDSSWVDSDARKALAGEENT